MKEMTAVNDDCDEYCHNKSCPPPKGVVRDSFCTMPSFYMSDTPLLQFTASFWPESLNTRYVSSAVRDSKLFA